MACRRYTPHKGNFVGRRVRVSDSGGSKRHPGKEPIAFVLAALPVRMDATANHRLQLTSGFRTRNPMAGKLVGPKPSLIAPQHHQASVCDCQQQCRCRCRYSLDRRSGRPGKPTAWSGHLGLIRSAWKAPTKRESGATGRDQDLIKTVERIVVAVSIRITTTNPGRGCLSAFRLG